MPNPINPAIYKIPTFHTAVASVALMAISAVAFGVLFAMNGSVTAHMLQMSVIGGAAGFGLAGFALSVAATFHTYRTEKKLEAKAQQEQDHAEAAKAKREAARLAAKLTAEDEAEAGPDGVHPLTLRHIQAQTPCLLSAAEKAIIALNRAHGRATQTDHRQEDAIQCAVAEAQGLLLRNLDNHTIYLQELLCFFGRGKIRPSIARRRLIVAHNCNSPKYDQVKAEHEAMERGYSPAAVIALFDREDAEILAGFPEALEQQFCLTDDELKKMGRELLDKVFGENRLDHSTRVLGELANLKAARGSYDFLPKLEAFVRLAFEEACLSEADNKDLCDRLVAHMLGAQFKANIKNILGIIARNIRLLPHMFEDKANTSELFPKIDKTFLLSESGDCMTDERRELQEAMIEFQSKINTERSPENRIALVVAGGTRIDALAPIFGGFIDTPDGIAELEREYDVTIKAVRVSISDHPFKEARLQLNRIPSWAMRVGFAAANKLYPGGVKGLILGLARGGLEQNLPSLAGEDRAILNDVIERALEALLRPIFDGSVNTSSPFREHFKRVITTQGEQIADALEGLEDTSVDEIIRQAEAAITSLATAFEEVQADG